MDTEPMVDLQWNYDRAEARTGRLRCAVRGLAAALAISLLSPLEASADDWRTHWMPGVNLAGAAFNPGPQAKLGYQYVFPTVQEIDYFVGKGLRTFRISVLSDRLFQLSSDGTIQVTPDWTLLLNLIDHAAAVNALAIVDFHQFGYMPSGLIGRDAGATRDFAQAWAEAAKRLKDRSNVIFGLMNEPHVQTASEWLLGANAAIAAIRNTGASQLILVPGSYWDGAYTWTQTDNATVMTGVVDPANNFSYELHQYLDADSSGTSPDVVTGAGATRLVAFTAWARAHHVRGFLGEFGFASTPQAVAEGQALVGYMAANRDGLARLDLLGCGAVVGQLHVYGRAKHRRRSAGNCTF
jgi:endoglucanase